jgi:predicted esterase
MRFGLSFATKPLLVAIVGVFALGCGQSSGSGTPSNSQPTGGYASSAGGLTSSSGSGLGGNASFGGTGGAKSSATGGASMGTSGTSTGGSAVGGTSAARSSSQQPEGGSSAAHSQAGGSSTVGGRTGSSGQGGNATGGSGGSAAVAGGNGGTANSGGGGGTTSKGGQGGAASGGTTTTAGQTGGATSVAGSTRTGGTSSVGGTSSTGGATGTVAMTDATRSISFGTLLDAQAVIGAAQQVAKSASNPSSSQWRAKGDQHRTYHFADANTDSPYRLYVPTNWDGQAQLPMVMFLHGSGSNESSYVDQNNKQMLTLAQQYEFILVSPLALGVTGAAYGNFLRLTAPFGNESAAAQLMSQVTSDTERINELSERDVINVLELVLAEYPVDRGAMFLTGHSMGSGGTWYIGGKYVSYWTALAPMSGPFVQQTGYPWDSPRNMPIFITEGTLAPSLHASHALRDWMKQNGFKVEYEEVVADHPGMVQLVLPDVFSFFDRSRTG